MKVLVVVSAILSVAAAQYAGLSSWQGYTGYPAFAGYVSDLAWAPRASVPHAFPAFPALRGAAHHEAPSLSSHRFSITPHGDYSYGYADALSSKSEARVGSDSAVGQYSYVDAHGALQTVRYTADSRGFLPQGTNLPVHTQAPVQDTAEVRDAKAEFHRLYAEAASRTRRSAPVPVGYTPEVAAARAEHFRLYSQEHAANSGRVAGGANWASYGPGNNFVGNYGPEGVSFSYTSVHGYPHAFGPVAPRLF